MGGATRPYHSGSVNPFPTRGLRIGYSIASTIPFVLKMKGTPVKSIPNHCRVMLLPLALAGMAPVG